jgi:hypothetical protein
MIETVEFEWDPKKAESNVRKHGVTFPFATRVFLDPDRQERPDEEDDSGEERWLVSGRVDEFVLAVVCTFRTNIVRMISARKATKDEVTEYWHGQIPS